MAPPHLAHQRHRGNGSSDGVWWPSVGLPRRPGGTSAGGSDQAYSHSNTVAHQDSCTLAHRHSCTFAHIYAHASSYFDSNLCPYCKAPHGHLDTSSHTCADLDSQVNTDSTLFAPHLMVALHSAAGGQPSPLGCTPWYEPRGYHAGQLFEQSDHLSRTAALPASCLHHLYTNPITDPLQTTGGLANIRCAKG